MPFRCWGESVTSLVIVSFRLFGFLLTLLLPLTSFAKDPAIIVRVVDGDTPDALLALSTHALPKRRNFFP